MPDLGQMLIDAVGGAAAMLVSTVVSDPGPWLLIALMLVGFAVLGRLARKPRRRR